MKKLISLTLAIVLILSLAACGEGADTPSPTPDATNTAPPTEAPTPTTEPTPSATKAPLMDGGFLNVYTPFNDWARGEGSLNWLEASTYQVSYLSAILETLTVFDDEGCAVPHLLESITPDKDALTWTLVVKEGITFSDSSVLDAETVAWNLNTYKEVGLYWNNYFSNLKSIDVVDSRTVVCTFKKWESGLPDVFANNFAMISKLAYETYGEEWLKTHPVGTGPFILESGEVVGESGYYNNYAATFVRNENYWGGAVNLEGINFIVSDDPAAAFNEGILDLVSPPDNNADDFKAEEGCIVPIKAKPMHFVMTFRLDSKEARQAMAYAIDIPTLAADMGLTFWVDTSQFVSEDSVFFNDEITGYEYDPEKARQLLSEAGYIQPSFEIGTGVMTEGMPEAVDSIADMFKEIGIIPSIVDTMFSPVDGFGKTKDVGLFYHTTSANIVFGYKKLFEQYGAMPNNLYGLLLYSDELIAAIDALMEAETQEEIIDAVRDITKIAVQDDLRILPLLTYFTPRVRQSWVVVPESFNAGYNMLWLKDVYIAE